MFQRLIRLGLLLTCCAGLRTSSALASSAPDSTRTPRRPAVFTGRAFIEIGMPRTTPAALDSIPHPSPGLATLLTATGIAIPVAAAFQYHPDDSRGEWLAMAAVTGALLPAAGHWYGGAADRAVTGIVLRSLGGAALIAAASQDYGYAGSSFYGSHELVLAGAVLGAVVTAGSALWDLASVSRDVEAANLRLLERRTRIGIAPARLDSGAPVLAVHVRFQCLAP